MFERVNLIHIHIYVSVKVMSSRSIKKILNFSKPFFYLKVNKSSSGEDNEGIT